ncbi:Ig-like V-type domain-containing protein [Elysia marginata]|uniref:Ig-like V-type domain-containing protein n=1 Tax=Elysia marginata TaxID=1093978 RepID=A0AAV4GIA1_9GAST|nr:Ig-like V-type domain-containing protein [Elysia marginata]
MHFGYQIYILNRDYYYAMCNALYAEYRPLFAIHIMQIKEVDLDMHDDSRLNHIYVTETHTLVMREVKVKHRGTYFCRDASDPEDDIPKRLAEQDLAKFLKRDDLLRFLYHLDVLEVSQVAAKLVRTSSDEENSGLPLPAPPINITELDVKIISSWQEWSLCSNCGDSPGTRRRLGQCTVKRHATKDSPAASLSYLGTILSLYKNGVPCRSSLFQGHKVLRDHVTRPDEVQEEECQVSCANYSVRMADILVRDALLVKQRKEIRFVEQEGHSLTIKCPQAPLDFPVAWVNGTRILIGPLLHRVTQGRVKVDERNHLHIKKLLPADAGHYACVFAGRVRGRMKLVVTPLPQQCKSCLYAYYLSLTFIFDFLVYCFMFVVRHRDRKQNLNYDLLGSVSDIDSDESSKSEGSSSDEGEDEDDDEGEGDESSNAWSKKAAGVDSGDAGFRLDDLLSSQDGRPYAGNSSNSANYMEELRGIFEGVAAPSNGRTDGGDVSNRFSAFNKVDGGSAFVRYNGSGLGNSFLVPAANDTFALRNSNTNNKKRIQNRMKRKSRKDIMTSKHINGNNSNNTNTNNNVSGNNSSNNTNAVNNVSNKRSSNDIDCVDQESGFAFSEDLARRNDVSDYITAIITNNVIGNEGTPGRRFWMKRI